MYVIIFKSRHCHYHYNVISDNPPANNTGLFSNALYSMQCQCRHTIFLK